MTIRFLCPSCGKRLKAPAASAGRKTLCTGCGTKVIIPLPTSDELEDEPAPVIEHAPLAAEESLDPFQLMPRKSAHPEDLIDMTAMVDIVFFMLIFFMVASAQAIVAVMPMPPAQTQAGATGKVKTVEDFTADPEFLIIRIEEDDSVWIDDDAAFGEMDVRSKVRLAREKNDERRSVLVVANADATHGTAVLVFDSCMDAGYDDIRLSVQETAEEAE